MTEGLRRWRLVLLSPKEGGNVGAAARVAKNFGAGGLSVVAPRCEVNGTEARRFSSGAAELLRSAEVYDTLEEALADRELTVGLSGVSGKHHRLDATGLVPVHLLAGSENVARAALVFGREEKGMTGPEMEMCDFLWSLPTRAAFPSLNLAQAVGIAAAGLAEAERQAAGTTEGRGLAPSEKALNPLGGSRHAADRPATHEELRHLGDRARELMRRTGWPEGRRLTGSLSKLRNLLVRGRVTRREASLLQGLCRQSLEAIDHPERFREEDAP